MNHQSVGGNIREARKATGLTQKELAKEAGVFQSHISELESGVIEAPSFPLIKKISKALKVSMDDLAETTSKRSALKNELNRIWRLKVEKDRTHKTHPVPGALTKLQLDKLEWIAMQTDLPPHALVEMLIAALNKHYEEYGKISLPIQFKDEARGKVKGLPAKIQRTV